MASLLPINFLEDAADALGWAHCIFTSCCQLHQLGQLFVSIGIADAPGWAHCLASCRCQWHRFGPLFFGRCCRCPRIGPFHLLLLVLMTSRLPIYFLADATDALRWSHCFFSTCCRHHQWVNY